MPDCEYCGKPLKKIGYDRSNGRLYAGNGGKIGLIENTIKNVTRK